MVDLSNIKARYAAMTDDELLQFAAEDGSTLTPEAFKLLKQEFYSRGLDTAVTDAIENGTYSVFRSSLNRIENTIVKEFSTTVLSYALNEKRDGKSDATIVAGLIENGMEEEEALLLITQLEKNAVARLAKANNRMLTGLFIAIAGIACYMISPKKPVITTMEILSVCAMGTGTIVLLKNFFDKNKYTAVINNIRHGSKE